MNFIDCFTTMLYTAICSDKAIVLYFLSLDFTTTIGLNELEFIQQEFAKVIKELFID